MKELSTSADLSKTYTNHSLRATTITLLDQNGFEARHIMAVSGHKLKGSIRSYCKTGGEKKKDMCRVLSSVITSNTSGKNESSDESSVQSSVPMKVDVPPAVPMNVAVPTAVPMDVYVPSANTSSTVVEKTEDESSEPDLTNVDFKELTSSQEEVFMESLELFSKMTIRKTI